MIYCGDTIGSFFIIQTLLHSNYYTNSNNYIQRILQPIFVVHTF